MLETKAVASFKEEQCQDPVISKIFQSKLNEEKPKLEQISVESNEIKAYWDM